MSSEEEIDEDYEQWLSDLAWMLNDARGRRIVWEILSQCGIFQGSFTTNGSATFFQEGRRHIGLWLMGQMQNPDYLELFQLMWRENVTAETIKTADK